MDWLNTHIVQATLLAIGALAMAGVAYHFLKQWRDDDDRTAATPSDLLTKFREMHGAGMLSDEEFRNIKLKLKSDLQQELSDNDEPG